MVGSWLGFINHWSGFVVGRNMGLRVVGRWGWRGFDIKVTIKVVLNRCHSTDTDTSKMAKNGRYQPIPVPI